MPRVSWTFARRLMSECLFRLCTFAGIPAFGGLLMDSSKYPTPHPQAAARVVDDKMVVVLADSGQVNVLNEVGSRIWELMDGTRTLGEIATASTAEYEVTPETAQHDVDEFAGTLLQAEAIVLHDTPPADGN